MNIGKIVREVEVLPDMPELLPESAPDPVPSPATEPVHEPA